MNDPIAEKQRQFVEELTARGERSTRYPDALHAAADLISVRLQSAGYGVVEQVYQAGKVDCRNLDASIDAFDARDPHLLVGAHYDSAPGTPGADDNASAVAVLLTLAERFADHPEAARLRFVAFTNEEPAHFLASTMGSRVFARAIREECEATVAMICLESLGVFSDEPGSQLLPVEIPKAYLPPGLDPGIGNFVAIVGNDQSMDLASAFARHFDGAVPGLPLDLPQLEVSDHLSFWEVGIPAIMLTDTAMFRNRHYHLETDTSEKLDYRRMAEATRSIGDAIEEWIDLRPPT